MIMYSRMRRHYSWHAVLTAVLFAASCCLFFTACRQKDNNITGPGPGPNGSWSIVLDTASTLHVPNDTISVRLFDPQGLLAAGKLLHLEATISHDSVSSTV